MCVIERKGGGGGGIDRDRDGFVSSDSLLGLTEACLLSPVSPLHYSYKLFLAASPDGVRRGGDIRRGGVRSWRGEVRR